MPLHSMPLPRHTLPLCDFLALGQFPDSHLYNGGLRQTERLS